MKEIVREAVDVLIASLEAGFSFDQALLRYSQEGNSELSRAFGQVMEEIRAGTGRRAAVRNMAGRLAVPEVTELVEALVRADEMGTSVVEALKEQRSRLAGDRGPGI